ncbi:hypothetical protein N7488_001020 [Penicillium malachiteum]|nr:hypothetical protein N7488_001020 [Penicillium malachiteum]
MLAIHTLNIHWDLTLRRVLIKNLQASKAEHPREKDPALGTQFELPNKWLWKTEDDEIQYDINGSLGKPKKHKVSGSGGHPYLPFCFNRAKSKDQTIFSGYKVTKDAEAYNPGRNAEWLSDCADATVK